MDVLESIRWGDGVGGGSTGFPRPCPQGPGSVVLLPLQANGGKPARIGNAFAGARWWVLWNVSFFLDSWHQSFCVEETHPELECGGYKTFEIFCICELVSPFPFTEREVNG